MLFRSEIGGCRGMTAVAALLALTTAKTADPIKVAPSNERRSSRWFIEIPSLPVGQVPDPIVKIRKIVKTLTGRSMAYGQFCHQVRCSLAGKKSRGLTLSHINLTAVKPLWPGVRHRRCCQPNRNSSAIGATWAESADLGGERPPLGQGS